MTRCPQREKTTSYLGTVVNFLYDLLQQTSGEGHKVGSGQGCLCRRYQSNGDQTRPTFINFMMATKVTFITRLLFPLILFHSLMKSSHQYQTTETQNTFNLIDGWSFITFSILICEGYAFTNGSLSPDHAPSLLDFFKIISIFR